MRYTYPWARLPHDESLRRHIEKASSELFQKLDKYDITSREGISDYNRRYFGNLISSEGAKVHALQKYSFLLNWCLADIESPLSDVVFMDYGGGHGMLALLAKAAGIGTVIHNDIFETSCEDARIFGDDLGLTADHYVPGDIDDVIRFRNEKGLDITAIANYDVIEHIYDIEDFLDKLTLLSNSSQSVFLASGANTLNPRVNSKLKKQHLFFEHHDRALKKGRKPTDETRALMDVRRSIIAEAGVELSEQEVERLAVLTRGLLVDKIQEAAITYKRSGNLPEEPEHPTNTCDPFTGNWFEHLMDPYHLQSVLGRNGYESRVVAGYYGASQNPLVNMIKSGLNLIIHAHDGLGLKCAPFYAIQGHKS